MKENQVTTPVEEVPAEPTHEVAQENAAHVPERQAEPKQICVPALVMCIVAIVLSLLSPVLLKS
mgnify:FL=1